MPLIRLLGLCFLFNVALAQAQKSEIHHHVVTKGGHQIHLLEFDPTLYKVVPVRANQDELQKSTVSALVSEHQAIAGINGGYFHLTQQGQAIPAGALKIKEQWLGQARLGRGAIGWNENNTDVLVDRIITKKNDTATVVIPLLDKSPQAKKAWQNFTYIVGGTPLLIKNGKAIALPQSEKVLNSFLNERHARTAICVKDPHHWVFVVSAHTKIPYRQYTSEIAEGFTISELTAFLQSQGCRDALNLDGGGSSTLVYENKVQNVPAGDMDDIFHLFHERAVSDAILLMPLS